MRSQLSNLFICLALIHGLSGLSKGCQPCKIDLFYPFWVSKFKFPGLQPLRPGQPKRSCYLGSYYNKIKLLTWLASFHMGALLCKMSFLRFLLSSIDSFFSASVTWTYYEQKRGENDTLEIASITTGNSIYIIWILLWYPSITGWPL